MNEFTNSNNNKIIIKRKYSKMFHNSNNQNHLIDVMFKLNALCSVWCHAGRPLTSLMWSGKVLQIVFSVRRGNIYTFFYFKYLSCINWLINNDQNISHCWRKYKLETRFLKRKVHDFFKKKEKKILFTFIIIYNIFRGVAQRSGSCT